MQIIDEARPLPLRGIATATAPIGAIAVEWVLVRTSLAADYPLAALLLFLWIVSDALMLAFLARSSGRPSGRATLGVMASAFSTVWLGSPGFLRVALWENSAIAVVMALVVVGHLGWSVIRARSILAASRAGDRDRWLQALSEVLPPVIVRLALAEITVIWMALFRWGGRSDVPANC